MHSTPEHAGTRRSVWRDFLPNLFRLESAGGLLLILSAFVALALTNSPFSSTFLDFWNVPVLPPIGALHIPRTPAQWINEGGMALFFLLVGLELKREAKVGVLADRAQIVLPGVAALGGIIAPALLFAYLNQGLPTIRGWAIPVATDIAFSLGVLSLFGSRVSLALKIYLTGLAIFDDLVGIVLIALFYSSSLHIGPLLLCAAVIGGLILANRRGVLNLKVYLLSGAVVWFLLLHSGIHATLAGVLVAMTVPYTEDEPNNPLLVLEHKLHHLVAFGILPLFALANAGVPLSGLSGEVFRNPLTLGIFVGLFFGKQLGVFLFSALVIKLGYARLPRGSTFPQLYAVALLTGIGFTMSLFIGMLAFEDPGSLTNVRIGVIAGSLLSAVAGAAVFRIACASRPVEN